MFDNYRNRMALQGSYMGDALKRQSDVIMDATFDRDPAYRICYLQNKETIFPEQTLAGYKKAKAVFAGKETYDMSELKDFEQIECKYLVNRKYSIAGDSVDYLLQFRPNAHGVNLNIRVGAMIFIPDDLGVYNLWLIVAKDDDPQFTKYHILKINLLLKWYISPEERLKFEGDYVDIGTYFAWCVQRTQSSYNSGVWTDYATTSVENQLKAWFPTNMDINTIFYNERFTITENPLRRNAWEVTKHESTTTSGLTKITFAQQPSYDPINNLSWINLTSENYSSDIDKTGIDYDYYCPRYNDVQQHTNAVESSVPEYSYESEYKNKITYSGIKPSLKIGGSYKTFTADLNITSNLYWRIHYINNNTTICTINFKYNGNELICDNTSNNLEVVDKTKIYYSQDGQKIFGMQYKYDTTKPLELKVKCQSILNMIGGKLVIEAGNYRFNIYASVEMEVESL